MRLIRWSAAYLDERGFESGRLNAELLLAGALGMRRLDLYLQFDRPLRPAELAAYKERLRRRLAHEPLQYIEGEAAFRGLTLKVDGRVLIPRPETEQLVALVLELASPGGSVLDIGTGSGAIALSLAAEGEFARVVATDASPAALELAAENAAAAGVTLELRRGDLFAPVRGERFDAVVSNPPYVALRDASTLEPQVRDWEPHDALFGGEDGLEVVRRLIADAPAHLEPAGLLALELGSEQIASVAALLRAQAGWEGVEARRDHAGRDRFITARRAG
jgi:release factor glutamine methyltransferase